MRTALAVLVAILGFLSGPLEGADLTPAQRAEAEAAGEHHNRLFQRSMYAFRVIHQTHGKAMRLAAALDACDLDAIAEQIKPSSQAIGETLQSYLAKDAPQDMDLFFELFAMAKTTDFYYQFGYAEGAKLIPAADKPGFCAAVTKKANELLAQRPQ